MQRHAVVDQFELNARTTPNAVAVEREGEAAVTYADLNRRANRVAHALISAGVRANGGSFVGLFLPAGTEYVAALLGVAKTGAVFLPLPPDLPERRLASYLEMAGVGHIVTDRAHEAVLRERLSAIGHAAQVVSTDGAGESGRDDDPGVAIAPGDGCYVMFTSGSTGAPKGILGQQRGLSHFLRWELAEFGLDSRVRGSWLAPPTFDVSLRDILVPLMAGGTLCIPAEETRTAPRCLVDWLAASRATLVHCVPTVLRLMVMELERRKSAGSPFPALRHLLVAGEPLFAADVSAWRAAAGEGAEVVNLYGPSETTLAKLFHRVTELPDDPRKVLPIGRPLPKTAALILAGNRLCLPGEIGEIHIQTPYRSLGYLNAPELTAAAFVPNPLKPEPDDIVYRTGDMGRYLPDGSVECLGRQDNQIKVNGIRIELAEVEVALRGVPGVGEAAAAAWPGRDGTTTLVGYYTRRDGGTEPLETERLRDGLSPVLPAAMQPRLFIALPRLPKTISGKINRKALPKPEEMLYLQHGCEPPEGAVEESLARIWGELFGLTRVGVTTGFLDYGGDSLKAIRATQAIYRDLGVEVPLKAFFQGGTIRALAAGIAQHHPAGVTALPHVEDAPDYPVSPAQSRLWRLDRMGVAPTAYNLAEAYRFEGALDAGALEIAVRAVIARHESLRTTFVEREGTPRQVVHARLDWRLERLDLRGAADPDDAAAKLARANHDHHFDLENGPLLRMVVARLRDAADGMPVHLFLFNIHHIIADMWSLGVLVRELDTAYAAARAGREPVLPSLPLQHRDVVCWTHRMLANGDLNDARDYWLDKLGGGIAALELPADRPRPPVQTFNGRTWRQPLGTELSSRLREMAAARGTTLFCVLTAVVKALLYRYTGETDIIVGSPVANRDHPDLGGQIGYLVNTVALRDRVEGGASFAAMVDGATRTIGEALAHQDYPFDALIDELDLPRDMSRSPVFDVMVVVQTFDPIDPALEGIAARPFGPENAWSFSRYDMVFHVQDGADGLIVDLNYNADLFDAERIMRCGRHLQVLAEAATLAPDTAIDDLPIIDAEERGQLAAFNRGPARARPAGMTISRLVAARAAEWPNRPALVDGDTTVSYAAMIGAVARLSGRLMADGVAPGDRIGVLAERSIAAVAALLAIMRAGAVYVPIDAALPETRTSLMLADAGCRLLLTDHPVSAQAHGVPVLAVEDVVGHPRDWSARPAAEGSDRSAPEDDAYIIFTSGSTGRPKPVVVGHAGFVNMSLGQIECFGLDHTDRTLQFASPSFDASLANIFMALFAGGAVVLPSRAVIESLPRFEAFVREQSVSCLTLPPTYLRALAGAPLDPVRVLITAGEAAPVAELTARATRLAAFNAYGPTEFSVCATIHRVRPGDAGRPRLPIGTPLPNTALFILDDRLRPVPIGLTGEVFLGGAGLARGYRGLPEETAGRFVTHPETGERLYRTGDLGRWLPDGTVDLVGRADEQVKIAGNRVEPGEVEAAMRAIPGIGDAHVAVVARPDGTSALAGWFTRKARLELWPSVAEFYVYDDVAYGSMAADEARNSRYRAAFAGRLAGKTVVDIGTGPVAVLARLAVEAGARKVYAIDLLEETAAKARRTVHELGLEGRIEVLHGDARTVVLPERVDWCISEIVGAIGGAEGAALVINEARRLLKDPANMLPMRSVTRIAAVSVPPGDLPKGFSPIAAHYVDRIFDQVGRPFDLRLCLKGLTRNALVSSDDIFEELDYTRDVPVEADHEIALVVTGDGLITGFLVWLDLHVDDGHHLDILDNAGSWLPVYLPAFPDGVAAAVGDRIAATVSRRLNANGLNPDFEIVGRLRRQRGAEVPFRYRSFHFGDGFRADPFWASRFGDDGAPRRVELDHRAVRRALTATLPAYAVPPFLQEVAALPMTSSGKVDRAALPAPDMVGTPAGQNAPDAGPASVAEAAVLAVWRRVLECDAIGRNDDFFALGGDSIRAIQIVSSLRRGGLAVEVRDLFQNPTVARLAAVTRPVAASSDDGGPVTGAVPLTPIQAWFFETAAPAFRHHFSQAIVLRSERSVDPAAMACAVATVWTRHDALRARFHLVEGVPSQEFGSPDVPAGLFEILDGGPEALRARADALHAGFDLATGPLFRAVLALAGDRGGDEIFLVAHHLVIDAVSWRIVVEDLLEAYGAAAAGKEPALPARTASYRDYGRTLGDIAATTRWRRRISWAESLPVLPHLPHDHATEGPALVADARTVTRFLDGGVTRDLLGPANRLYSTDIDDLLLAGLMMAVNGVFGRQSAVITLETHGREHPTDSEAPFPDVTRTVGWFTGFHPLALEGVADDVGGTIRAVRNAVRRVPDRGRSFGLLTRHPAGPGVSPVAAEIGCNYLGSFGTARLPGGFTMDLDAPGTAQAAGLARPHALDLLAMVLDGRLELALTYDSRRWTETTITRLTVALTSALQRIVRHCRSEAHGAEAIREFTLGSLSGRDLDALLDPE